MIVDLFARPEWVAVLVDWIQREWPQGREDAAVEERLCGKRGRLPFALVEVRGDSPVGFASVVCWQAGIAKGQAYWIDAVYVLPEWRGRGLARALIAAAVARAGELGLGRLFALTDVPGLYTGIGWSELERSAEGVVVSMDVPRPRVAALRD